MTLASSSLTSDRRCLAILLFVGNSLLYAMRVNLSLAIVAMVGSRNHKSDHHPVEGDTCPLPLTAAAPIAKVIFFSLYC